MNNIIIVSGWFDPVHKWHVEYFKEAALLWYVILWLNSDKWLERKKWKPFMNFEERKYILQEFKSIWEVLWFNDDDWSANNLIEIVYNKYKDYWKKIIFAKWWDRTIDNIPEVEICNKLWIEMIFWIGKSGKVQSSSNLLKNWTN